MQIWVVDSTTFGDYFFNVERTVKTCNGKITYKLTVVFLLVFRFLQNWTKGRTLDNSLLMRACEMKEGREKLEPTKVSMEQKMTKYKIIPSNFKITTTLWCQSFAWRNMCCCCCCCSCCCSCYNHTFLVVYTNDSSEQMSVVEKPRRQSYERNLVLERQNLS